MSNNVSTIAYAKAMYQICIEHGDEEACYKFAIQLKEAFLQNDTLQLFLSSPRITHRHREDFLNRIMPTKDMFALRSTIKFMCYNFLAAQVPHTISAFIHLYQSEHKILPIKAVTAVPLSQNEQNKLSNILYKRFGKKIELSCQTDLSCIGGVKLYVQGQLIDGTLQTRLEKLHEDLIGATVFFENFTRDNEELI